jgi:hypothetical protein
MRTALRAGISEAQAWAMTVGEIGDAAALAHERAESEEIARVRLAYYTAIFERQERLKPLEFYLARAGARKPPTREEYEAVKAEALALWQADTKPKAVARGAARKSKEGGD